MEYMLAYRHVRLHEQYMVPYMVPYMASSWPCTEANVQYMRHIRVHACVAELRGQPVSSLVSPPPPPQPPAPPPPASNPIARSGPPSVACAVMCESSAITFGRACCSSHPSFRRSCATRSEVACVAAATICDDLHHHRGGRAGRALLAHDCGRSSC